MKHVFPISQDPPIVKGIPPFTHPNIHFVFGTNISHRCWHDIFPHVHLLFNLEFGTIFASTLIHI